MKKLFQHCHGVKKRCCLYSIDETEPSEFINKWQKESYGQSEGEIEVSDNSDSYFSDESFQMIQLACENLHDDFDVRNEPVTESLKKNKKRTVPVHKVYTPPM